MNKYFFGAFGVAAIATSVFFTNARERNTISVTRLQNESRLIKQKLSNNELSRGAKQILRIHKQRITEAISIATKSNSCATLIGNDPNMISGRYTVFRSNNSKFLFDCLVSDGRINQQAVVGQLRAQTKNCTANGSCVDNQPVEQAVFCVSKVNKRQNCPISNTLTPPEFVAELDGSVACRLRNTYGVTATHVWTENGCKAKFKVLVMPSHGLASRNQVDVAKKIDKLSPFQNVKLRELKEQRDDRVGLLVARLKTHTNSYLSTRQPTNNAADTRDLEEALSTQGQKISQEIIHLLELSSCSAFKDYLSSKDIFQGISGSYYFYSPRNQENYSKILNSRPVTYQVKAEPVFCDYTRLYEASDSSNRNHIETYDDGLTNSRLGQIKASTAFEYTGTNRSTRFLVKASEHDSCPQSTIARCVAKYRVKYSENGPYSFVDNSHFGNTIYEANGMKFCFRDNEEFKFDYKNLVHGYLCIRGWSSVTYKSFNQFVSVPLGEKPINDQGRRELRTIGCLSKHWTSAHFRRNERSVLVGDDLTGVSRNIHAHTVGNVKKYYCLPNSMTTPVFEEQHLVAAYLLPNQDGSNNQTEVAIKDRAVERAIEGSFTMFGKPIVAGQPRSLFVSGNAKHKGTLAGVSVEAFIIKGNGERLKVKTTAVPPLEGQIYPGMFMFDISGAEVISGRKFEIIARSRITGVPDRRLKIYQTETFQATIP